MPEKLVDWIIGQDKAVAIVKKAAKQRRNLLLMGSPGTGKSMLAQAMAELMPAEELEDVLVYPNKIDENNPLVRVVKTYAEKKEGVGQGRMIVEKERAGKPGAGKAGLSLPLALLGIGLVFLIGFSFTQNVDGGSKWIMAATILGLFLLIGMLLFTSQLSKRVGMFESAEPRLIVDNSGKKAAPFVDGTGAKAGALFGDVRHDPLQSGGLGTPPHLRVEAGAIHRANRGVLFVDEVSSLGPKSQQELLSALQDKRYSITGQSEMSSGAMVRTEPVPCDFVLVAAGNLIDMRNMHPALRSRIRGYGYEIYMEDSMPDDAGNRGKLAQFVAQEVKKDGKIPHFDAGAIEEIVEEARRRSGRKNRLSLRLRELGGIVRAAGDVAREEGAEIVNADIVRRAKKIAQTLEQQVSQQIIDLKKDYKVFETEGAVVGKVNGLAVMGDGSSGIVLPIVAEVTPASSRSEGKLIATGKLGKIAREAVDNVSAIIKKHMKKDVSQFDIHVQFLQTYEGVEGDSASIATAVAVLSAMEGIEVEQGVVMTGSLSVRGEVLPVGGVTPKIEAGMEAGAKKAIIPKANADDIYIEKKDAIGIVPAENIVDVLEHSLRDCEKKKRLIASIKKILR